MQGFFFFSLIYSVVRRDIFYNNLPLMYSCCLLEIYYIYCGNIVRDVISIWAHYQAGRTYVLVWQMILGLNARRIKSRSKIYFKLTWKEDESKMMNRIYECAWPYSCISYSIYVYCIKCNTKTSSLESVVLYIKRLYSIVPYMYCGKTRESRRTNK